MENGDQNFAKSLDIDYKLMVKMLIVIHLDCGLWVIFLFSLFPFSSNFLTRTYMTFVVRKKKARRGM